ncbi:MAG: DNA repair protein RecN (Recombination protein N) [Myxococcota bacterium]|jgi:DNA repair protein RecN (Recombination protein N)
MINTLTISNFAIIEHQRISFSGGYTAITGETGAGKSILIKALALAFGGRASTDVIRTGSREATIEAEFELSDSQLETLRPLLIDRGLADGDRFVVRRIISANGRSRIDVNDCPTRLSVLKELTTGLADVIGQHASHDLLESERHVVMLDSFAGTTAANRKIGSRVTRLRALQREVARLRESAAIRDARTRTLRNQLREIDMAGLAPGEDERLNQDLERLQHAEQLQETTKEAFYVLRESDTSILDLLSNSINQLQRISHLDEALAGMVDTLSNAQVEIQETTRDLGRYSEGVSFSPEEIAELQERQILIDQLKEQHGGEEGRIEDVLESVTGLQEELDSLAWEDDRSEEAAAEAAVLQAEVMAEAVTLSTTRQEAAIRLAGLVEDELAQLGMPACRFRVRFLYRGLEGGLVETVEEATSENLSSVGLDELEFLISPNPGEGFKSVARIASGGELSRTTLALKGALIATDPVGTYIFDEVDTGIGGGVAETVGRKLQGVGEARQVICITHLPQVASCSHQHLKVFKVVEDNRTFSAVRSLSRDERVAEVSRMLGGSQITAKTREHAEEMITRARTSLEKVVQTDTGKLPLVWSGPTAVG